MPCQAKISQLFANVPPMIILLRSYKARLSVGVLLVGFVIALRQVASGVRSVGGEAGKGRRWGNTVEAGRQAGRWMERVEEGRQCAGWVGESGAGQKGKRK